MLFFFLVTSCLVVAVQPCMEWIPIKKKKSHSRRVIRWDNDLVWVVYPDGSRCWYTGGLGWFPQSNKKQLKKISFKSRRIKPLLQLYLNVVKHLTLQYLPSKNNQNCFQYIFQPVFTSYFELASSVSFSRFLNIFRLGVINSKNV